MTHPADGKIIRTGTWLYAGSVKTDVRLVQQEVTYGTGDDGDSPDLRDDRDEPCYVVWWGVPGEPGVFKSRSGQHRTIDEALAEAEGLAPGIKWD